MKPTERSQAGKRASRPERAKGDKAWDAADWKYSALVASSMVPLFGKKLTPEEEMDGLEEIVRLHPAYYPALYHLGGRKIATGQEAEGRRLLLEAVDLMARREGPAQFDPKSMDNVIEFLEENLRYDVARELLERLIQRYPHQALFYDELGAAALFLGDEAAAAAMARKAVELDPQNAHFLSNLGWAHLVAGRLDEAGKHLARSLALMPANEVTQGNCEVLRHLKRAGGTFMDYLLRPLDRKALERLEERCDRKGDFRDLDQAAAQWNHDRLDAWKRELCRRRDVPDYSEVYKSLRAFFGFVEQLSEDTYLLYEDMGWFQSRFARIMNKFIFKMSDADAEVIGEIYAGLLSFYGVLTERGLADKTGYARFRSELLGMKRGILGKAARYAKVRHDDSIPEQEKERGRGELFEGDHQWPGI